MVYRAFYYSHGCGRENISFLLTISKESREKWFNGILENSIYARIHISQYGEVKTFSGHGLKIRNFKAKTLTEIINKINKAE